MKNETKPKVLSMSDSTHAFAVPGESNLIDCIHPETGLSWINSQSLREMQGRYPNVEVVNIDEWCKAKAAKQESAVEWLPSTEGQYWEMLEVLPPACMFRGCFLVGEPWDHHATSGQPRFQAYIKRGGEYTTANRPMTISEFKQAVTTILNPANP